MKARMTKVLSSYIYNTLKYHTKIQFGSIVSRSSSIHGEAYIEYGCYISNSILNEKVEIYSDSRISDTYVDHNVVIASNCIIGNSRIGPFSYISFSGLISYSLIGKFCSIGPSLICGPGDHPTNFISTSPIFFSTKNQCGISFCKEDLFCETPQVTIGNDVWIGAHVFIKNGVTIGHGAIIGAGAVVVSDVPAYAIVTGVPAKVVRFRFQDSIVEKLLKIQWWDWDIKKLIEMQVFIAQNNPDLFLKEMESKTISKSFDEIMS